MNKLFESADLYLQESDWKDLAVIKFCLFSVGVLAGTQLPEKYCKPAQAAAAAVFVGSYVPLMAKYFKVLKKTLEK